MAWSAPTTDDVLQELLPAERAKLEALQASTSVLASILARVVGEVRDAIRAGGYALDEDNADFLPIGLHNDTIAMVRWRWLSGLPNQQLATEPRKAANEKAEKKLEKIANQDWPVEPPTGASTATRSGNWNSENKLVPRTHPLPRPATQHPATPSKYANPSGPEDTAADS